MSAEMGSQSSRWLRQRALGNCQKSLPTSIESMRRLKLESCLEGHSGCVNCLEWNRKGNLLASGSDDRNVIIWDPFRCIKRNLVKTNHEGNIFSVKFIQDSSDTLIATCASDCGIKLFNIVANENIMNCKSCHMSRVKRLAVHPNEPHLVWSAGEEGYIMQYDIREEHVCNQSKPKNLLLDLRSAGMSLSAKCLAINPIRDEMLAVGSNDAYVRLFDRRFTRSESWNSCTAYFAPGHLLKTNSRLSPQTFGTTYLAFSPDGSELLANVHAEQVYLFNTYEPWEGYKSYDTTVKELILDLPATNKQQLKSKLKSFSLWQDLKRQNKCFELPVKYRSFYQEIDSKLKTKAVISKKDFDKMNESLVRLKNCPELYHLRASALIYRGWRGDHYQAIRDCCCALALNPLDYPSLVNLACASCCINNDKEAAVGLYEIVKTIEQEFGNHDDGLRQASRALSALMRHLPDSSNTWIEMDSEEDGSQNQDSPIPIDGDDGLGTTRRFSVPWGFSYPINRFTSNTINNNNNIRDDDTKYTGQSCEEKRRASNAFDYTKRFCGHCNMNTDIKEANFFGRDGEFIVAGSDDGAFYIWDKKTTNIVKAVFGDMQILNCLQPHPNICMLATSGIEPLVKLWSPSGKTCQDVKSLELRCSQNQDFITSDPLEAMIMMLYPNRDI